MNKSLFIFSIAALMLGAANVNLNKIKASDEFVDCGYDAINENIKATRYNALEGSPVRKGANKDAGNEASLISSKLGVQAGKNSKGQNCMRFAVAIPSLDVQVVFDRTLTKTDGTVTYGQVVATGAYESLVEGDDVVTPESWKNQFSGAEYKYFAVYTMSGIPDSEFNAKIEVSATVTAAVEENEEETSEPVLNAAPKEPTDVEVYNSGSLYGLLKKTPDGQSISDKYKYNSLDNINTGDVIVDEKTGCSYRVTKAADGTLTVSASQGAYKSGNSIKLSSVYVEIAGEVVEIPVVQVSSTFSNDLNNVSTSIKNIEIPVTVKTIDDSSFASLNKIETITYLGTPAQWNEIKVSSKAFQNGKQGKEKISVICNDGKSYILDTTTGKINTNAGIEVNTTPGAK